MNNGRRTCADVVRLIVALAVVLASSVLPESKGTFSILVAARAQVAEDPPPPRDPIIFPVSSWKLDETSGTVARDSRASNHGTHAAGVRVGALRLTSGSPPNYPEAYYSADYDGTSGRTTVNSSVTLNPTSAIALEVWVNPDTLPASSASTSTILRKDSQYLLRVLSNGAIVFRLWVGGAIQEAITPAGTITVKKIHHLVATYNGSSQVIYVNGVARATRAQAGSIGTSANPLLFGASSSGGIYDFFDGRIDEVAIYSTAPSASWVSTRYNSMVDKTPPDTTITSAPPASTTNISPAFSFVSTESGSTFQCKLDAGAYTGCVSPKSYSGLSVGSHTFSVKAIDPVGNVDASPASYSWNIVVACSPTFGNFDVGNWPAGCWRPYADNSPFNQAIPVNPKLDPNSVKIIAEMRSPDWGGGGFSDLVAGLADCASPDYDDYQHPTYYSKASDPLFTITRAAGGYDSELYGTQIRIPAAARPACGSDAHMTVIDQATGWEYDFWQVTRKDAGGGVLAVRGAGRTRIDGKGLNDPNVPGDANAGRWGLMAGIIRAQEMEVGQISHALFMVVKCDNTGIVYPATGHGAPCRDAAGNPNYTGPPMGARLQLNMSEAEINALNVPAWKKTILRALAKYGAFVGDTGGSPWDLQFESGSTYTSFGYPDEMVIFAQQAGVPAYQGLYIFNLKTDVDWSRLRVIDPCVTLGNCSQP